MHDMITDNNWDDVLIDDYFNRSFYHKIVNKTDVPETRQEWFRNSDRITENCIYISNIHKSIDETIIYELFSKG